MTTLTVNLEWQLIGKVDIDRTARLRFPDVSTDPGLYRFWIDTVDERPGIYVGEASNLRRRMQHYRTPGSGQPTNLRMNRALMEVLTSGGTVSLRVATDVSVTLGKGSPGDLDLSRKNQRLVGEQAAIAEALLVEDLAETGGSSTPSIRASVPSWAYGRGSGPRLRRPRNVSSARWHGACMRSTRGGHRNSRRSGLYSQLRGGEPACLP